MTPTKTPEAVAKPQVSAVSGHSGWNKGLDRAHEVRKRRARLRQDLKYGHAHPQVIVSKPPEWMETATVEWLLLASPAIGPKKAAWVLDHLGISPTRGLGHLSQTERRALVIAIVQKGWRK